MCSSGDGERERVRKRAREREREKETGTETREACMRIWRPCASEHTSRERDAKGGKVDG